ncbi:MAG TPA: hypothetical protein VKX17_23080 [Planctomycetota bacterium]|nr:hypothetical protein [Planctomycetota bacterium]
MNVTSERKKESTVSGPTKDAAPADSVENYHSSARLLAAVVNLRRMTETRRITMSLIKAR